MSRAGDPSRRFSPDGDRHDPGRDLHVELPDHGVYPVPERQDVPVDPLVFQDGAFELPTTHGLRGELNVESFDQYVYQPGDVDHFTTAREIVL